MKALLSFKAHSHAHKLQDGCDVPGGFCVSGLFYTSNATGSKSYRTKELKS